MTEFEKSQANKILNCYDLDIQKSFEGVPDGTISKDGKKIKRAGQWVWRRKNKGYISRDLKEGQKFVKQDSFGKQYVSSYTISSIENGIVKYSFESQVGQSSSGEMTKKEFVDKVSKEHKVNSATVDEKINLNHVDEEQQSFVKEATEGIINPDLDFDSLPETVQDTLISILNKKFKHGGFPKKENVYPTPANIKLVNETGLNKLFKNGEIKDINDGKDVEVFIPEEGFVTLDSLGEYNAIHKIPLPTLKKILQDGNRKELKSTVDSKIWSQPPMPVFDSNNVIKQAWLGDYVNFYTKGASNPHLTNNIKIQYRIVKFLKNSKGEDTWILKDEKGDTRAITRDRLSDQITLDTTKENSLLKNKK